ncbi:Txe/YoeB family addiction module toxin [candidate division KSB1 bacterium]|nr:MAG: Txe/YoeB family addiction module toxin [candidate division KSB1 bacterium]
MSSIVFEGRTWDVFNDIQEKDKKLYKSICRIISELERGDPTKGPGKPEALKYNLAVFWSRRLSLKDRIIYKFDADRIYIFAIGGHYNNFQH